MSHLSTTSQGKFGPDVYNSESGEHWDLTTEKDWDRGTHQAKYDSTHGSGTGIFWR